MSERHAHSILVGVDGSPSSVEALRWAAHYAELVGGEVHAVTSWRLPTTYGWIPSVADFDWAGNARDILDQAIKEALDESDAGRVRREVVEGHPASVLLRAARESDLLVVGSRGHGEFTGMMLGSVAQQVVTHATCPVLVIRTRPALDRPDAAAHIESR